MKDDRERWKTIPGYPEYQASDRGRIRRVDTLQVLKASSAGNGSLPHMTLMQGKKKRNIRVHRVVAMTFLPDYDPKLQVEFRDRDRGNAAVSNLTMGKLVVRTAKK